MYPNLYFAFQDLLGLDWPFLKLVNSFGFFVAMAFISASFILKSEFIRLTKSGAFSPNTSQNIIGKPASPLEILSQAFIGFIFGWKFLYPEVAAEVAGCEFASREIVSLVVPDRPTMSLTNKLTSNSVDRSRNTLDDAP